MARCRQKGQAVAVSDDFVASWALMSADLPAARPALQASQEVDVVVVGGGFAGLHTALALAEYGQSVMLLEEGRIAGKASGANAGMVEAGFFVDFDALMAQIGAHEAQQIYRLSMAGVERLRGLIRQSGQSDLLQGVGALTVSRQPQGPDFADAVRRKADKTGAVLAPVARDEVRSLVRSERYYEGVRDPLAFQVQPLRLAYALAALAEQKGARLYEDSKVCAVEPHGHGFRVKTTDGAVMARQVVLAGGATLGGLNRQVTRSVLPIAATMGMTEPLGDQLAAVLSYQGAVTDDRWLPDYFRAIEGGRLVWGRRVSRLWLREPLFHKGKLEQDIAEVFPALSGVKIERSWAGVMVSAPGNLPQIVEIKPGLWLLGGLGGLGMAWSAIGGEMIATALAQGDKRHLLLKPFGPKAAGGWLGRLRGQARLWSARYHDWQGER